MTEQIKKLEIDEFIENLKEDDKKKYNEDLNALYKSIIKLTEKMKMDAKALRTFNYSMYFKVIDKNFYSIPDIILEHVKELRNLDGITFKLVDFKEDMKKEAKRIKHLYIRHYGKLKNIDSRIDSMLAKILVNNDFDVWQVNQIESIYSGVIKDNVKKDIGFNDDAPDFDLKYENERIVLDVNDETVLKLFVQTKKSLEQLKKEHEEQNKIEPETMNGKE
jgi:hypothetical protein